MSQDERPPIESWKSAAGMYLNRAASHQLMDYTLSLEKQLSALHSEAFNEGIEAVAVWATTHVTQSALFATQIRALKRAQAQPPEEVK